MEKPFSHVYADIVYQDRQKKGANSLDDEELVVIYWVQLVGYLFIAPIFFLMGVIGSVINLIVLSGPGFNSHLYFYLRALSVSDLSFLISAAVVLSNVLLSYINGGDVSRNSRGKQNAVLPQCPRTTPEHCTRNTPEHCPRTTPRPGGSATTMYPHYPQAWG